LEHCHKLGKFTRMIINRRQFLLLTAGFTAGCQAVNDGHHSAAPAPPRAVNVGPARQYAADGVYSAFRDQGVFLIRRGEKLFALSAICTHRKCKLSAEPDLSFYCKCHGSTFDPAGHVTEGPARRDLPRLPLTTNPQGELLVHVPAAS
jgi:Rieske Fe-S protein